MIEAPAGQEQPGGAEPDGPEPDGPEPDGGTCEPGGSTSTSRPGTCQGTPAACPANLAASCWPAAKYRPTNPAPKSWRSLAGSPGSLTGPSGAKPPSGGPLPIPAPPRSRSRPRTSSRPAARSASRRRRRARSSCRCSHAAARTSAGCTAGAATWRACRRTQFGGTMNRMVCSVTRRFSRAAACRSGDSSPAGRDLPARSASGPASRPGYRRPVSRCSCRAIRTAAARAPRRRRRRSGQPAAAAPAAGGSGRCLPSRSRRAGRR